MSKLRFLSVLLGCFFIGFIGRALLFYFFIGQDGHYAVYFDTDQYLSIAQSLVKTGNCSLDGQNLSAYRLPGYPVYLAFFLYFFTQPIFFALCCQLFLSLSIIYLGYALALTYFPGNKKRALFIAALIALHPGFMIYATILSTETLFVLVFLKAFYDYTRALFFTQHRCYYSLSSGFFLGLASLIRPLGHYLFMLMFALWCIYELSYVGVKKYFLIEIKKASFLLSWLAVVASWLIRNYLIFGSFFFHTLPGLHFLQYSAARVVQAEQGCSYVEARAQLMASWREAREQFYKSRGNMSNEWESCQLAETLAAKVIKARPDLFMYKSFLELLKTFFSLYSAQLIFADTQKWGDAAGSLSSLGEKIKKYCCPEVRSWWLIYFVWYELLFNFMLLLGTFFLILFFFYEVISFFKKRDNNKARELFYVYARLLGLTAPLVMLFWFATCAYGCARLRLPFEYFLILYAVIGWQELYGYFFRNYYRVQKKIC